MINLTLTQKIILKLVGCVYIGDRVNPGWRGPLPFYAFKCEEHGIVENYSHGYEKTFECLNYIISHDRR